MSVKSNEFESEHRIGTRRLIFHISVFVLEIALTFGKIEKQQKIDRGRPVQKRSLFFISKCKSGAKQVAKWFFMHGTCWTRENQMIHRDHQIICVFFSLILLSLSLSVFTYFSTCFYISLPLSLLLYYRFFRSFVKLKISTGWIQTSKTGGLRTGILALAILCI